MTLNLNVRFLPEPLLKFSGGNTHSDPRSGLLLYGPSSLGTSRHKEEIHIGFVGSESSVEDARELYKLLSQEIPAPKDSKAVAFPGMNRQTKWNTKLTFSDRMVEILSDRVLQRICSKETKYLPGADECQALLTDAIRALSERDHPLDYIVVCLPEELYKKFGPGTVGGMKRKNLRRALKAAAMSYGTPTQILRQATCPTYAGKKKPTDHLSTIAWNLATGLYAKVDGLPWTPAKIEPDSCFLGVSFYRPDESNRLASSVAQAFDENGDGIVLRGRNFEWDFNRGGREPHLTQDDACELMEKVLQAYKRERGHEPSNVTIHKTSIFSEEESKGFNQALKDTRSAKLVSFRFNPDVRLLPDQAYPIRRGAAFSIDDRHFIYPTGFLEEFGRYPHGHLPTPIEITSLEGGGSVRQTQEAMLMLTKMNWNASNYAESMPVTIRFSQLVSDVFKELKPGQQPNPKYKFYM